MTQGTQLKGLPSLGGAETLGEQLRSAIESAIIEGVLEAGARIHPDELAAHFGVSRIPVREALRSLDASGWVEIRPRQGVYIRQRHPEELEQLFEVRAPLEAQACRLAALRATEGQRSELAALASAANEATGSAERYAQANSRFHAAIVAAAGNEVLAATLKGLRMRVQWYYAAAPPRQTQTSIEEHTAIVDAIVRQDAALAARLGEQHVVSTLAVLREQLATDAARSTDVSPSGP